MPCQGCKQRKAKLKRFFGNETEPNAKQNAPAAGGHAAGVPVRFGLNSYPAGAITPTRLQHRDGWEGWHGWTSFGRGGQDDYMDTWALEPHPAPMVGQYISRTMPLDDGGAVTMLGEPCDDGVRFPDVPNTGYVTAAGRPS